jgi:pyrroline-5-carboxylate reductase
VGAIGGRVLGAGAMRAGAKEAGRMRKIGAIGVGKMGSALIKGMLRNDAVDAGGVMVYDALREKSDSFASENGVRAAASAAELAAESDFIMVAVKPGDAPALLESIKGQLGGGKIIFSIVLGISLDALRRMTDGRARYVRCMPNTPALVSEGMICVSFGGGFDGAERREICGMFSSAGLVEELPEKMLAKITALTGSSPAYVFMFIEAMADAAVHEGVPRDMAYRLAAQSVLGSAKLLLDTRKHPGELKDMVCSPGGTTIEAVRVFERMNFRGAVIEAMLACGRKARELSAE